MRGGCRGKLCPGQGSKKGAREPKEGPPILPMFLHFLISVGPMRRGYRGYIIPGAKVKKGVGELLWTNCYVHVCVWGGKHQAWCFWAGGEW